MLHIQSIMLYTHTSRKQIRLTLSKLVILIYGHSDVCRGGIFELADISEGSAGNFVTSDVMWPPKGE